MTYNFTVTFSRPDELDANVYTSGYNATALSVATAEASVRRQHAHLTVRSVVLSAVLTEDGDIVGGPVFDLGREAAARLGDSSITPAQRVEVRDSLVAQRALQSSLGLSTAWWDGFLLVANEQVAHDEKVAAWVKVADDAYDAQFDRNGRLRLFPASAERAFNNRHED